MGLLGAFKVMGEEAILTVREWLGKEYVKDVIGGTVLFAFEELVTNTVTNITRLAGWKRGLVKNFSRLIFSGLYFYGLQRVGAEDIAIISSMLPIAAMVSEGLAYLMGGTPEEYAERLSSYILGRFKPFGRRVQTRTVRVAKKQPQQQKQQKQQQRPTAARLAGFVL